MKFRKLVAALAAALALYLLFWPTGMEPVAWTPPPAPSAKELYAPNDLLRDVQLIANGVGVGPEAINVDAVGRLYTGYADGRVVMLSPDGGTWSEMTRTEGRPLGLTFGPNGGIIIADSRLGLLHLGRRLRPLLTELEGAPLTFLNDVDNTRLDKHVYFTQSSSKFDVRRGHRELLEHGGTGRLLAYNVATQETRVLLSGLHYPNGVAVGPDDAYVLVSEMGAYRVLRYWLKGEKAGTHEVFVDNLPGFPDNLSFNNRDRFWLALTAPRSALLDRLLPGSTFLRRVLGRLPALPEPPARAFVLGLDLDGAVVANLQYAGPRAFAPITSVREHGPWLYFGTRRLHAIGRLPLERAVPGAQPPPAGWEQVPSARPAPPPTGRKAASRRKQEREDAKRRLEQQQKD